MNPAAPILLRAGSGITVQCVAFDSLGVKGMCTRIQTPDITITIDPGVSPQTEEFPLPEEQRQRLWQIYQEEVLNSCVDSHAIVISHYHLDHITLLREAKIYSDKIIFAKSPDDLPQKQQDTARRFFQTIDGLPREIIWADGRRFKFKKTEIGFSPALWHGEADAEPGRVIMTEVKRGRENILFTSDVAGLTDENTTTAIHAIKPRQAIIDGYPSFLHSAPATSPGFIKSIINLCRILALPELNTLILDHHLARDYRYPALFKLVYAKAAKLKKNFGTAAEIAGGRSAVLKAMEDYGTTRWHRWFPVELDTARTTLEKLITAGRITPDWLNALEKWVI